MLNKIFLQGRLTRDPEYDANKQYARYSLAMDNRNGETDFFDCVTFKHNAEFANKYLNKGKMIIVEGEIHNDNYTNKEGKEIRRTTITVNQHHFCDSKSSESTQSTSTSAFDGFAGINAEIETDLPFA